MKKLTLTQAQMVILYQGLQDTQTESAGVMVHLALLNKVEDILKGKAAFVTEVDGAVKAISLTELTSIPAEILDREETIDLELHVTEAKLLKDWAKGRKWPTFHRFLKIFGPIIEILMED